MLTVLFTAMVVSFSIAGPSNSAYLADRVPHSQRYATKTRTSITDLITWDCRSEISGIVTAMTNFGGIVGSVAGLVCHLQIPYSMHLSQCGVSVVHSYY